MKNNTKKLRISKDTVKHLKVRAGIQTGVAGTVRSSCVTCWLQCG